MRICLNLDPSRLLRWHLWVADALAARPGNEVFCRYAAARHPIPTVCRLLFDIERMIYGSRAGEAVMPMEAALRALPSQADGPADLTIDFAGEVQSQHDGRIVTPLFNGVAGEIGVIAALMQGQDIFIELRDSANPRRPWTAKPASADRDILSTSLEGALSCAVALIVKAVHETAPPQTSETPWKERDTPPFISTAAVGRSLYVVTCKAAKLLDNLVRGAAVWNVGWRLSGATSLIGEGKASFRILSGGTSSYLADPFPFRHRGRDYIFFEQFPFATNKGCISVVTVEPDGTIGEPRIVLQEQHHLSYPFVFERDGSIWMIPEAGESGNVDLYRAVDFPYRWERAACLAEGLEVYDATPLDREDGTWFFVTPRSMKSTAWDMLGIYHAESLTGAWKPHARNPVLIDATLSRPAGAFFREGGRTLRPVQDCARFYGGGVTLCRLDALTETTFKQTAVGRIGSDGLGCHTYNRSASLEVVDLFGNLRGRQKTDVSYWPVSSTDQRILPLDGIHLERRSVADNERCEAGNRPRATADETICSRPEAGSGLRRGRASEFFL